MALTTGTKLNAAEKKRLAKLEKTITDNLASCVRLGLALKEVRDSKLYRENSQTFQAYVASRWDIELRRAQHFITAAECHLTLEANPPSVEIANNCSSMPANEAQYREVAKAPEELQTKVVEKAAEIAGEDKKPTAKDFATAREMVVDSDFEDDTDTPVGAPSDLEKPQPTKEQLRKKAAKHCDAQHSIWLRTWCQYVEDFGEKGNEEDRRMMAAIDLVHSYIMEL